MSISAKFLFTQTNSTTSAVTNIILDPELVELLGDSMKKPDAVLEIIYDQFSHDVKFPDLKNKHVATMHDILLKLVATVQASFSTIGTIQHFSAGKY